MDNLPFKIPSEFNKYWQKMHDSINNKFSKDTLSALIEVEKMYSPKLLECKLSIPTYKYI